MRNVLPVALLLAVACAGTNTAQRPAHIAPPGLEAAIVNEVFFGSGNTAPATVEVKVTNTANEPVTVTRIEVDSAGMAEWGLQRQSRVFREVIEPGATKPITFFANAVTNTSRRTEPLSFNVRVEFEGGGTRWQQFLRVISTIAPR